MRLFSLNRILSTLAYYSVGYTSSPVFTVAKITHLNITKSVHDPLILFPHDFYLFPRFQKLFSKQPKHRDTSKKSFIGRNVYPKSRYFECRMT